MHSSFSFISSVFVVFDKLNFITSTQIIPLFVISYVNGNFDAFLNVMLKLNHILLYYNLFHRDLIMVVIE